MRGVDSIHEAQWSVPNKVVNFQSHEVLGICQGEQLLASQQDQCSMGLVCCNPLLHNGVCRKWNENLQPLRKRKSKL
jgi:hypothetical protein